MRIWLDIALIAFSDHWKWAVGAVAVLVALVAGTLFLGILGRDTAAAELTPAAFLDPAAAPHATLTPIPASDTKPVPAPSPTAVPTPIPDSDAILVLPSIVNVPIYLTGAKNVGSLEFILTYDPSVLEVSGVEAGGLARNALFDFGPREPGRLWAGLIDSDGINGDGPVAVVSFRVIGPGSSASRLNLESIYTYDASSLLDILSDATSGSFTVEGHALTAPALAFPR